MMRGVLRSPRRAAGATVPGARRRKCQAKPSLPGGNTEPALHPHTQAGINRSPQPGARTFPFDQTPDFSVSSCWPDCCASAAPHVNCLTKLDVVQHKQGAIEGLDGLVSPHQGVHRWQGIVIESIAHRARRGESAVRSSLQPFRSHRSRLSVPQARPSPRARRRLGVSVVHPQEPRRSARPAAVCMPTSLDPTRSGCYEL